MTTGNPLEAYLVRFHFALSGMTLAEQQDIVAEIRAHIQERAGDSGMSVEDALARLGQPEDLAREYNRGALVRRASNGFSPLIVRAAFAWAMTGAHGGAVLATALFGYASAFGFMLCCVLKMMFPNETGLWIGPDFELGFRPGDIPQGQEVLGSWFEPIAFGIGLLFFTLTTMLMRTLLPRFKMWRTSAWRHTEAPRAALQSLSGLARSAAGWLVAMYRRLRHELAAALKRADGIRGLRS